MTQKSQTITQRSVYYQNSEPLKAQEGDIWTDYSGNNIETNQYRNGSWELIIGEGPDTPQYPIKGALWTDGDGTLKKYDGSNWSVVAGNPIDRTDTAETFTESDVNINHTNTAVESGSVSIIPQEGSTATRPSDSGGFSGATADHGIGLVVNNDIDGIRGRVSSNTGTLSEVAIGDNNGNVLTSKTGNWSSGDTFDLQKTLSSGNNYALIGWDGGNNYTVGELTSTSPPQATSTDLDISGYALKYLSSSGYSFGTSGDLCFNFDRVTSLTFPSSGNAEIEWSQPSDINQWDKATYLDSPDGETVDVYLATSTDGGSTWSRINSGNPISRGYDLSNVSSSSLVRFEVEFSRNSTTNHPSLDAAYRRWSV